jgi:hypothetical protein
MNNMSEIIVPDWDTQVTKIRIYDLEESVAASKYPMATDTKSKTADITKTVLKLAQSEKGAGHDQFLSGIIVNFDLTASVKMWTEMERYRFVYFVSSESTMHRIAQFDINEQCNEYVDSRIVDIVNELKEQYLKSGEIEDYLTLLYSNPTGFMLTARLTTNYRALKTIYSQRKDHRLPEWRTFCEWIAELPHSEFIIGE